MKQHEQVPVTLPGGEATTVDKEVKPLLQCLWAMNVVTLWSCQGFDWPVKSNALRHRTYVCCRASAAAEEAFELIRPLFGSSVVTLGSYDGQLDPRARPKELLFGSKDHGWGNDGPRFTLYFPRRYREQVLSTWVEHLAG